MKTKILKLKNKINKNNTGIFLSLFCMMLAVSFIIWGNQNKTHDAELRFTENSSNKNIIGSIMPASCESNPNIANGDGNFSGCAVITCWNGVAITPAAGQVCPDRPTIICWDNSVITPSLGQSCPPYPYCGADTGTYSGTPSYSPAYNLCYCNAGETIRTRTVETHVEGNVCSTPVITVASKNREELDKFMSSLYPEKAYAGVLGPVAPTCLTFSYHFCALPAAVNIKFR